MAEEVYGADQQIEQRARLLGEAAQLQRGALVETQGRIVGERQRGPTCLTHPKGVTDA
jgi:hypothetical protein